MKLILLRLDDSISQISFKEEDIEHFSRFITGHHFDETRSKAVIEVFDILPVKAIRFIARQEVKGKETITRFDDMMQRLQDLGQEIDAS